MSSSNIVRPVVGQRILIRTVHPGAEKRLFATAMGTAWPLHGIHYLRDKPRTKVLTRWPPSRAPKVKIIHEGVASAMNITVLRPDPGDPSHRLTENLRIPRDHLKYFTFVHNRLCHNCGSRAILRITRFRQTAEVCRSCNAVLTIGRKA